MVCFRIQEDAGLRLSIGHLRPPGCRTYPVRVRQKRTARPRRYRRRYTSTDDVTFSSSGIQCVPLTEESLRSSCSGVGDAKANLQFKNNEHAVPPMQRRMTRLVISNEGAGSLGRARKRQIRAAMHHCPGFGTRKQSYGSGSASVRAMKSLRSVDRRRSDRGPMMKCPIGIAFLAGSPDSMDLAKLLAQLPDQGNRRESSIPGQPCGRTSPAATRRDPGLTAAARSCRNPARGPRRRS